MEFRSVRELKDARGKKVLLRLDLNVPVKDGAVADDFRIKASVPTLDYLKGLGAKVIILSHIGEEGTETLKPVADYLKLKLWPLKVDEALQNEINRLADGEMLMLENLRQDPREVANVRSFAEELASLGDIYVSDAFSVSHRRHASIVLLPKLLPCYAGLLLESEVSNLSRAFNPEHPFLFIVGGAKFETKIGLVKKFVGIADKIFIGGALATTIAKKENIPSFVLNDKKIILPIDVTAGGLDLGPKSLDLLKQLIDESKFILWNGPMGNFEKGFKNMTEELAVHIAKSGARSIVGGGDTLAAIRDLGVLDKFTFVSSGGGAMLDFLANGTLPGLEALL